MANTTLLCPSPAIAFSILLKAFLDVIITVSEGQTATSSTSRQY